MNDTKESVTDALRRAFDILHAMLDEAQRNSERLDWIDQQTYAGAGPRGNVWMVGWKGHTMHGLDFRSAIDTAKGKQHDNFCT